MESFLVRPLAESDLDTIIERAGGTRAHPDADRRSKQGADNLLEEAVIELKSLDEEGLGKPERQQKLATLFRDPKNNRPVIVIDRNALPEERRREYDSAMQGPIKTAVSSAKKQLAQSRVEFPSTSVSVLLVINNGYTALNHEALLKIVVARARNDTREIDGVVVAGCYFHSDTFDNFFLWPIDYVAISARRPFTSYEKLRKAWNAFAERYMTAVVQGAFTGDEAKASVKDTQFDVNGVTYVKPAPSLGGASQFFVAGRPRMNSSGFAGCPPVATTFPEINRSDWELFRRRLDEAELLFVDFDRYRMERDRAASAATELLPFVPISVTYGEWGSWCAEQAKDGKPTSTAVHANELFETKVRKLITSAKERSQSSILPARYVLAVTEVIGQDCRNDVSHIGVVREMVRGDSELRILAQNARVFHEHAVALASAYAVAEGIDCVLWEKDLRYAWV